MHCATSLRSAFDDLVESRRVLSRRIASAAGTIGGDVAGSVSLIAYPLGVKDVRECHLLAAAQQFAMAAAGPLFGIGEQEELAPGVRKHNRSLIAALAHHVAVAGDRLLPILEPGPSDGTGGHRRRRGRDFAAANRLADVRAVQEHLARRQLDNDPVEQLGHGTAIAQIDARPQSRQSDGAKHGPGVEILKSEPLRQQPGRTAFACPGRCRRW